MRFHRHPFCALVAGLLLASAWASAQQSATAQWTTASGGNGHYYQVVGLAAPISWSDANTAATQAGGYLATITSANENTFVFNLTNSPAYWDQSVNDHGPWLGGFQPSGSQEPAGGWQWVTQPGAGSPEPFSYTNWAAGQPSNDNGIEDSLNFFHSGTGTADTWNDEANSNTFVKSYVIEYNSAPTPEPGTALAGVLMGAGLLMRRRRVARRHLNPTLAESAPVSCISWPVLGSRDA